MGLIIERLKKLIFKDKIIFSANFGPNGYIPGMPIITRSDGVMTVPEAFLPGGHLYDGLLDKQKNQNYIVCNLENSAIIRFGGGGGQKNMELARETKNSNH